MDDNVFAEVVFKGCVVVGNVDYGVECYTWESIGEDFLYARHHEVAVGEGEVDAVEHLVPVAMELFGVGGEVGHVNLWRNG